MARSGAASTTGELSAFLPLSALVPGAAYGPVSVPTIAQTIAVPFKGKQIALLTLAPEGHFAALAGSARRFL